MKTKAHHAADRLVKAINLYSFGVTAMPIVQDRVSALYDAIKKMKCEHYPDFGKYREDLRGIVCSRCGVYYYPDVHCENHRHPSQHQDLWVMIP